MEIEVNTAVLGAYCMALGHRVLEAFFDVSDEASNPSCVSSATLSVSSDSIETFQERGRVLQTKLGFL